MINKITWTLFDSKIEEEIYYESDEYFDTEADIYSISDLVSEVFCVTQFKEIKNNMDISVDIQDEQINKLQEFSKKLNEFMKYAKEIIRYFTKSFNELNELKKNEDLEELIINYYDDIENNNSLKIQEIEKKILERIEDINYRNEVEKIFNETNNDKYDVLIKLLPYIGTLYETRYKIYALLKKISKKNSGDSTLENLPKIIMSNYFEEYYKNQLSNIREFYEDKQKEYCSISINENFPSQINDLISRIKNIGLLSKKYYEGDRCFALADVKIDGSNKEIIAFSGVFDSEHDEIKNIFKPYESLLKAIKQIKDSERFKNASIVKTEFNTRYYFDNKYIELQKVIDFSKNINSSIDKQILKLLKGMFSCCETKILSSNFTIENLYVKYEPCIKCKRALIYNKINNKNVFTLNSNNNLTNEYYDETNRLLLVQNIQMKDYEFNFFYNAKKIIDV